MSIRHDPESRPVTNSHRRARVPDREGLLRANEVAQYLGVGVRTVWKLRATGRLESVSILGATRFRAADVDRLAREGVR